MARLLTFLAACDAVSGLLLSPAAAAAPWRPSPLRLSGVQMSSRWPEAKILDESVPDPVFDDPTPYKGRVPYGFCDFAEKMNGRAAMMAFVVLYLQEAIVGTGVFTQYGLSYDAGAVVPEAASSLPWLVGFGAATAITLGATFSLTLLDQKLSGSSGVRGFAGIPLPFGASVPGTDKPSA